VTDLRHQLGYWASEGIPFLGFGQGIQERSKQLRGSCVWPRMAWQHLFSLSPNPSPHLLSPLRPLFYKLEDKK